MDPAEKIQAAIDKLEAIRRETPSVWAHCQECGYGPMLVVLHRTIDAQLAILRAELDAVRELSGPLGDFAPSSAVLALADEILGDDDA